MASRRKSLKQPVAPAVLKNAAVMDEEDVKLNSEHLISVHQVFQTILDHDIFANISNENSLEIDAKTAVEERGYKEPFNKKDFDTCMTSPGYYECGGNLAWIARVRISKHRYRLCEGDFAAQRIHVLCPVSFDPQPMSLETWAAVRR